MTPIKPAIRTPREGDHKGLRPALAAASYEPGYQDPERVNAAVRIPSEGDHKGLHPTSTPLPPLL